jgi:UDP-N-acetylglucosamine acyltransferase
MTQSIHPTAIVHPDAKLGSDVEIGPYAVLESAVTLGDGASVGAHAVLHAGCRLGRGVLVSPHVVLGGAPQDLGFDGAPSLVVIGDHTVVREYVTIHRSSNAGDATRIGAHCLLMASSHIGHDCHLGEHVIVTSQAGLSGHVDVGDRAVIGGQAGFHQFVRVGRLAMVGGKSRIHRDVPPFVVVEGNPCRARGLNVVGMRRAGLSAESRSQIKRAFRLLYRSGLNTSQALERIRKQIDHSDEVESLVAFIETCERGIAPGTRATPPDSETS